MRIEFEFNSVSIQPQDIQGNFPNLISTINSYQSKRRRPRKNRKLVSCLIDDIIQDVEK